MPNLNHSGPDGKGPRTGRQLGKCKNKDEVDPDSLGKGRGLKRRSGGGQGQGKRLRSSELFDDKKK
ncbi:MAG: DUF5320 domain-containing protein [Bacteroidales bacterium]|nr:DUF5320 domain-containing protein [Bacteroidales bacterium]